MGTKGLPTLVWVAGVGAVVAAVAAGCDGSGSATKPDCDLPAHTQSGASSAPDGVGAEAAGTSTIAFVNWDEPHGRSAIYLADSTGGDLRKLVANRDDSLEWFLWSPDGRAVMFPRTAPGGQASTDLWSIAADGTRERRLAASVAVGQGVEWSPDARRIVFERRTISGGVEIWRVNADGRVSQRLTNTPAIEQWPTWSPDGRLIAYARAPDSHRRRDIWIMRSDGTCQKNLTESNPDDGAPRWSADGTTLAFNSRIGRLFVVRPDGSGLHEVAPELKSITDFRWSPIGHELLVVSRGSIYVASPDSRTVRRLTRGKLEELAPDWSPDGRRVAFMRWRPYVPGHGGGTYDAYTVGVAGGDGRRVTGREGAYYPEWSPDGRQLGYTSDPVGEGGLGDVRVINADGTSPQNLTRRFARRLFAVWGWQP